MRMRQLSQHLWQVEDSCNVYLITGSAGAVCVDFGTGSVLEQARQAGVQGVTDVLMTHHHRDQAQGLPLAVAAGANIWVPHAEQDLFHSVDAHWQAREVWDNYNMRQDRFSLLEPVPVAGTLHDYVTYQFGDHTFQVVPTPGHTTGSVSLLAEIDGARVAFTGDLIAGAGKLWSLAATQWSYNGGEGLAATILSLLDLKERRPAMLLPSHGEPISNVDEAIDLTVERLLELVHARGHNPHLLEWRSAPFMPLTEHMLWNRTCIAYSYVLLSQSGRVLFFDFGYDFALGLPGGSDRASRHPWLYTLPALKAQFGVTQIDVAIPTHFHDDHVAGLNLLREVEGAQVWAAASFADILERPARYDLPCLWYDPIPVDRVLPLEQPIRWEEYELTLYALHGHTRYAVAISVEVDGQRMLVTGDQYQGNDGAFANYVYHNQFAIDDYRKSAALYRSLAPDLILSGHWPPLHVQPGYFGTLDTLGETIARLHDELLPEEVAGFGAEGFAARIEPYQAHVRADEALMLDVAVQNPNSTEAHVEAQLVTPRGWRVEPTHIAASLPPDGQRVLHFCVTPCGPPVRRARVAADLTIKGKSYGQQAEALVSVT
jgi:glyoxylase-like metal-dependent hydrolase (beta-lactamase superfamily II)